jgi:uncharacterized protein YbcV (DUF1398 family)
MFTITQIKEAHSKVKSGADFPAYIQGADNYRVAAPANYDKIPVAPSANKERFIEFLVMHQDGQTDYLTFCNHAALCGIAKWSVNIIEMTCTYFDPSDAAIVIEKISS